MDNDHIYRKDAENFGLTIKTMRRKRHLTQENFSEVSDIGVPYISNIETGSANPTLKVVISLAKSFDVTLSELFSVVEESNK